MFGSMTRWVRRDGRRVEFGNVVGPFIGTAYSYAFPDEALAAEFEACVATLDERGNPAPVDPARWGRYRVTP